MYIARDSGIRTFGFEGHALTSGERISIRVDGATGTLQRHRNSLRVGGRPRRISLRRPTAVGWMLPVRCEWFGLGRPHLHYKPRNSPTLLAAMASTVMMPAPSTAQTNLDCERIKSRFD